MKAGPWVFDDAVAKGFDDSLDRSAPNVELMRRVAVELVD